MRPAHLTLALVLAASFAACGDDDNSSDSVVTAAAPEAPTTGLCALIPGPELSALFPVETVFDPESMENTDDRCAFDMIPYGGGRALGSILMAGAGVPIDTARANAVGLGQPVVEIDGLGDAAYFTNDGEQFWVSFGIGEITHTTAVTYVDDVPHPALADMQAALEALAAEYLATL